MLLLLLLWLLLLYFAAVYSCYMHKCAMLGHMNHAFASIADLTKVEPVAVGGPDDEGANAAASTCTTNLSCSRESAGRCFGGAQSACDVVGLVGSVCMCGIPLVNGFIDMISPEQFLYYLILMLMVVKHGSEQQFMGGANASASYVDFACQ